jgi:hypothetical protein
VLCVNCSNTSRNRQFLKKGKVATKIVTLAPASHTARVQPSLRSQYASLRDQHGSEIRVDKWYKKNLNFCWAPEPWFLECISDFFLRVAFLLFSIAAISTARFDFGLWPGVFYMWSLDCTPWETTLKAKWAGLNAARGYVSLYVASCLSLNLNSVFTIFLSCITFWPSVTMVDRQASCINWTYLRATQIVSSLEDAMPKSNIQVEGFKIQSDRKEFAF